MAGPQVSIRAAGITEVTFQAFLWALFGLYLLSLWTPLREHPWCWLLSAKGAQSGVLEEAGSCPGSCRMWKGSTHTHTHTQWHTVEVGIMQVPTNAAYGRGSLGLSVCSSPCCKGGDRTSVRISGSAPHSRKEQSGECNEGEAGLWVSTDTLSLPPR